MQGEMDGLENIERKRDEKTNGDCRDRGRWIFRDRNAHQALLGLTELVNGRILIRTERERGRDGHWQ